MDADRFVIYFAIKLVPVLGDYSRRKVNSMAIMGTCFIHMDVRVPPETAEAAGAIIIFLAPFFPEVIPIKHLLSQRE